MSRILFLLVALIGIALSILLFLPGLIPVAAFKDRIETAATNSVGREVTIGNDLSFRIFPRTAFHVKDLTIANEEGFDAPYLLRVEEADIGVKLLPLLSESVEIDRFVLTRPDIKLARKQNGEINWAIGAEQTAEQSDAPATAENGNTLRELKLGDVRIVEGSAIFNDDAANQKYSAEDINLTIVLNSLKEPLEARGNLVFQDTPSTIDMVLTSLADLMAEEPGNLKLNLTIGDATAGADLTIATKNGIEYSGPATIDAPDLPALAALMGTELADAPGFDKLAVKGNIDGTANAVRLGDATINFDDITANGAMTLDWSGPRPKADGVLSTETLDLRPYMPPPATSAEGFPEWSDAKMDFSSLRNMDAVFDITTNAIYVNNLVMGESRIKLMVDAGRMTAEIPELSMYGGQGSGRFVLNARSTTPSFAGNFDMNAVKAQPLSKDLLRHDNLLGLGSFKFNFNATGASQAAIMNSIDGSGGFDLANGALKGVNIAGLVRAVGEFQEGFNPAALQRAVTQARGPSQQTDFSEFLSDFSITDGLVNAPTITLNGPHLNMTGKGTINLAQQTIDLRLVPKANSKLNGEGGRTISIPVRVGGTFSKPTIGVDAESLARTGIQKGIQDLFNRGNNDEASEEGETEESDPAKSIIDGLFGRPADNGSSDDNSNTDESATAPSTEEQLINEGLNALFGKRKNTETEEQESDPQ
ncbi:AsmA family protein [Hyphococcus sp. DH-69]|uniref:AsmA family protein n=1 Tax=Hyphococcus formosus TaxID=3143534 RepID=UPI00398B9410